MIDQIVTPKRSLTEATESLLNQQIEMEGRSSAAYLAMASWCETRGYEKSAAFLYEHSDEERGHMLKLFGYINQAGGHALHPQLAEVKQRFNSLREVFELILEHEIKVTHSIHELVDHCFTEKDFTTFNFLQWFVVEQREEEALARRALELFTLIGEEGLGLWTIDQEIAKLHQTVTGPNEA